MNEELSTDPQVTETAEVQEAVTTVSADVVELTASVDAGSSSSETIVVNADHVNVVIQGSTEAPAETTDVAADAGAAEGDASPEASVDGAIDDIGSDLENAGDGLMEGDFTALWPLLEKYLLPAVFALLILFVAYLIAKFLGRSLGKMVTKRVDETLGKFLNKLVFYSIMAFAFLGILGYFGISVASFAAVIAAMGFAIGLAFQGTLSNFAAGVMLLVFRPFKVGDVCRLDGEVLKVESIDLFVTYTNTLDNRRVIMPNSSIFGSKIEVITHHPQRRVEVMVGVAYAADTDKTREVLNQAVADTEGVLQDPEPMVVLWELADSSVNWNLWVWAESADFLAVKQALIRNTKKRLEEAGLEIPFPQMDVHLNGQLSQTQG